jgi:ABC-2 type transport system permease protein
MLRRIVLIAKRDYVASVFRKAFLIGLVLAPLLFGGSFAGIGLLRLAQGDKQQHIALIDHTGVLAQAIIQADDENNRDLPASKFARSLVGARYVFEVTPPDEVDPVGQRAGLSERVRNGGLAMFADIGKGVIHPGASGLGKTPAATPTADNKVTLYATGGGVDATGVSLTGAINTALHRVRLQQFGMDSKTADETLAAVTVERLGLVARDATTGSIREAKPRSEFEGFIVPFAMTFLMMMIVMGGSAPMLAAVAEDKMQRVFEMLLALATPFELMMGKVLAAVGRSLTSSIFYVVGALLGLQGAALLGLVPFHLLPWFFVYMIAEVTMLSALAASLGAACSTPRDAGNFAVILILPVMLPSFLALPLLQDPNGTLALALSFFPPFTPMVMLLRQSMPSGVPGWQPWVGLAGVILCALLVTWVAARIFRVGILMQGKPPRLADLARWAVRG